MFLYFVILVRDRSLLLRCQLVKVTITQLSDFAAATGRVSLARENEAGAVGGRKSIFSMLTYRTLFCFWL